MKQLLRCFRKTFDFRSLKSAVLLASIVCTIFFLVSSDSFINNNDLPLRELPGPGEETARYPTRVLRATSDSGQPENIPVPELPEDAPLLAPVNATDSERIQWLRNNLEKFDVYFNPADPTREFNGRVVRFFQDGECAVRFFMTWISPARLFGRRELLAVETLFKSNPRGCLVILSRSLDSRVGRDILKPVTDLGFKVITVAPDLVSLFNRTPVHSWFDRLRTGDIDPGEVPLAQNLSNLIRLAVLYRFGGVYLDADFIVLRDFTGLSNSVGAQSVDPVNGRWTRINNAVMVFDRHHPLVREFMREFAATFDGSRWGHNGPYLVSRVVARIQKSRKRREGFNFTVLPPAAFYPVSWIRIGGLFEGPRSRAHGKWVAAKVAQLGGGTYGVHLWNKQSRGFRIEEGSVIGRLVSDHCLICEGIYGNSSGSSPTRMSRPSRSSTL